MNAQSIISAIETENFTGKIRDLYGSSLSVEKQKERYRNVTSGFARRFGDTGDIRIYSAPGRTEIGGNHTDHQHGRVLAAAVNADIICAASPCDEERVTVVSEGFGEFSLSLADLEPREENYGKTEALIAGVFGAMKSRGYKIGGFKGYMSSQVPGGSGLSSSAAFEILIGYIISEMFNNSAVSAVELAEMGQFSENVFFGKPCGLMDQMACAQGGLCQFDFADPSHPEIIPVNVDLGAIPYDIAITETGGSHEDLTDEYAAVPLEMKGVAQMFGEEYLKNVTGDMLLEKCGEIREKLGDRAFLRAVHFVNETKRAAAEAAALEKGDMDGFMELFRRSGHSSWELLQNVSVCSDPVNQPVAVAIAVSRQILGDNGGYARVHGGGFAGTIQAFVRKVLSEKYRDKMDQIFGEGTCHILEIRKYGGIRVL